MDDISMDDSEGDYDEEQLQEAMRMSMLPSVTTEREADTGGAGRVTHDGRSTGQLKGDPKYVASDQDIFTTAETSVSTLHTAGTPKMHPVHRRILLGIFASTTFRVASKIPLFLFEFSTKPSAIFMLMLHC